MHYTRCGNHRSLFAENKKCDTKLKSDTKLKYDTKLIVDRSSAVDESRAEPRDAVQEHPHEDAARGLPP